MQKAADTCGPSYYTRRALFGFAMGSMFTTKATVFTELKPLGLDFLVFGRRIVPLLTLSACKGNYVTHSLFLDPPARGRGNSAVKDYSMISLTTPAPTVRPPSRMAKRSSLSMAIGVIRFTVMLALSPGITISVPSASSQIPVTSVVRK